MALHIRDFRQSDAAELSRLSEAAHQLGLQPAPGFTGRIFVGVREDCLAGAIWLSLEGDMGIIPAILVSRTAGWHSDILELIAEASLWLASRGAARIELRAIPQDKALLAGLLEMQFKPDASTGVLRRLVPARSAA
jgi:hypothetical protein